LDNIRHLHESIESKLLDIDQQIKNVNAEINKRIDNFVSQLQNRGSNSAIGGQ
jgi:tetrahydromethanopterin S-methyltransferase subunit G